MVKYLVRHWLNADFIAEKVVDENEINIETNDLGKNKSPDGTFSYVMIQGNEKVNRTTYEIYDESINNSSKERTSNK
tara:strand:+ start:474 stop:704 length:231 start_codon:yes stop_codon:yes gene_type:complete